MNDIKLFLKGNARLHGAGSVGQRSGVRLIGRLVLIRLHDLQAPQRPFAIPSTQDERQARDRQDDHDHVHRAARFDDQRDANATRGFVGA